MSNTGRQGNETITILKKEKWALENKAKQGWRCFFIMRDMYDNLSDFVFDLQERNGDLRKQILNNENVDVEYLKRQFIEMYEKLEEYTECSVCFDRLTKDNMELLKCGHIYCKSCISKLKENATPTCPTCRKKIVVF